MRRLLIVMALLTLYNTVHANGIDSLHTEQDVRKFLKEHLESSGFNVLYECVGLPPVVKVSRHEVNDDSILVTDPTTGRESLRATHDEYDRNYFCGAGGCEDCLHFPFERIHELTDSFRYRFYKVDIDGNGLTDLVVDATLLTMFVMDDGNKIEGHILSSGHSWEYKYFKGIVQLPDGGIGVRLRHDYNSCDYEGQTVAPTDVSPDMLTDTIVYRFGGFANYNPSFRPGGIVKIDYYWHRSQGLIPAAAYVCSEISKNGRCLLHCLELDTVWSAMIDSTKLNDLWSFIAYADLPSKKDSYTCLTAHGTGSTFAVYFDNGTVKKIAMFEHNPLTELGYLSKKIADVIASLHWTAMARQPNFECPCVLPPFQGTLDVQAGIIPQSCDCR